MGSDGVGGGWRIGGAGRGRGKRQKRKERRLYHDNQAICWPTAQEKHDASDWVERVSCHAWRPGYCMVDGTLVTLYAKPGHYGDQFFDHKCQGASETGNVLCPSTCRALMYLQNRHSRG